MAKETWIKTKDKILTVWDAVPTKVDWTITFLILILCYVSFVQGDILITGNRSFLLYKDFFGFYEASYDHFGDMGANYLPSTFILFALWNLPLYLLGRVPSVVVTSAFLNLMWYKMLPVLFYFGTSIIMEKVALEMGFGKKKAKLCRWAFIVCPVAVFSQFIFSQYDIFTIFFILLGIYYYLKDDWKKFCLFFGIAITFKYHALLYFMILLLLKEKRIIHIFKQLLLCIIPFLCEVLLFIRDPYFREQVLGFGAIDKVNGGIDVGYFGILNLVVILHLVLFMWAYVTNIEDKDTLIKWMFFLCSGVSFIMFGICAWHPQWLILSVPFFVFSIFINEHGRILLLLENVLVIALYMITVNYWPNHVDQHMLYNGIFKYALNGREFVTTMRDIYGFDDISMLCSIVSGVLLLCFVFNHPKHHIDDLKYLKKDIVGNIKLLFIVGTFAFLIPAGISLGKALAGETRIFNGSQQDVTPVMLTEDVEIQQYFVADTESIYQIDVFIGTCARINESTFDYYILDAETNTVVYEDEINTEYMFDDNTIYTILDESVDLVKGKTYILKIEGNADISNAIALYVTNQTESVEDEYCIVNGEKQSYQLSMTVYGK